MLLLCLSGERCQSLRGRKSLPHNERGGRELEPKARQPNDNSGREETDITGYQMAGRHSRRRPLLVVSGDALPRGYRPIIVLKRLNISRHCNGLLISTSLTRTLRKLPIRICARPSFCAPSSEDAVPVGSWVLVKNPWGSSARRERLANLSEDRNRE